MLSRIRQLIPQSLINLLWHFPKAVLANLVYGFPSRQLTVIGITGTSGKTTTTHLLYHLLLNSGYKVVLISSIAAKIGAKQIDIGLHVTNPDPFSLQRLLKTIVKKGYTHLVLEVTSHGLDQHRCWGIDFTYGVILNIRHEHLDYHGSWENYRDAKLKLVKAASITVLNRQDKSFVLAKNLSPGKPLIFQPVTSYQAKGLLGDFNQENIAAAITVAKDLGLKPAKIKKALNSFPGIPGRMEIVQKKPFTFIIDFAHKPDALQKALESIAKLKGQSGRIISVFGSAGLRDTQKRPLMGKISAKLSDITILTAEDPRTEKVKDINDQIEAGFNKAKIKNAKLYRVPDRQKAINLAVKLARPGDYVVLFGKSHEKSMCFGTIEYPWSEHQAVRKALKLKPKS